VTGVQTCALPISIEKLILKLPAREMILMQDV